MAILHRGQLLLDPDGGSLLAQFDRLGVLRGQRSDQFVRLDGMG